MKLAQVEHSKCGEYAASTYVWIPDDMGEDEFQGLADAAVKSYLDSERVWKNNPDSPKHPGYNPPYHLYQNTAVCVVAAEHKKNLETYQEWDALRKKAREPFMGHLVAVSGGKIKKFWDVKPSVCAEVSWGHNHGVHIEMSETDVHVLDFGTTKKEEELQLFTYEQV